MGSVERSEVVAQVTPPANTQAGGAQAAPDAPARQTPSPGNFANPVCRGHWNNEMTIKGIRDSLDDLKRADSVYVKDRRNSAAGLAATVLREKILKAFLCEKNEAKDMLAYFNNNPYLRSFLENLGYLPAYEGDDPLTTKLNAVLKKAHNLQDRKHLFKVLGMI